MTRIAIFASGNGSNAENIANYLAAHPGIAEVSLILTNKKTAGVIERANRLGIPVEIVGKDNFADPVITGEVLDRYDIDFIVLAGFLLMIPDWLVRRFNNRIVNIHPSLLPRHGGKGMYGHHVHESVIASGDKETGITIHFVNEECDGGAIIFQSKFEVKPEDSSEDIEARVHELEYRHFPEQIAKVISSIASEDSL